MLLGTEIGAALTALEPFEVDAMGLNCATGPTNFEVPARAGAEYFGDCGASSGQKRSPQGTRGLRVPGRYGSRTAARDLTFLQNPDTLMTKIGRG